MNKLPLRSLSLGLAVVVALAACGKKEEAPAPVVAPAPAPAPVVTAPPAAPMAETATFAGLTLGNAVDANQNVTASMMTFAPTDTIYAAVATRGSAPNAALVARWTYGDGQLVDESSQSIAPAGDAMTTFHIAKADGFPAGKYEVAITLDGNPVASQAFEVK